MTEQAPVGERQARGDQVSAPEDGAARRLEGFRRWRTRVKSRRMTRVMYRAAVGVIGGAITLGGLFLVPLPGPGWVVVFVGLAILATEFTWAARLRNWAKARLAQWSATFSRQSRGTRAALTLAVVVLVVAVVYLWLAVRGVPGWLPSGLTSLPGLGD